MNSILNSIYNRFQLPSVVLYLQYLNIKQFILSIFFRDKILLDKKLNNKRVAIIALFQKGVLRKDVKNLLKVLKNKGYFLFGINTLKLNESEYEYFDRYIERFNYGRDFGSYKTGFLNIFKDANFNEFKPSVLMLNDSVFYSYENIDNFIDEFKNTNLDVLGATENVEIEHHIGSFCINFSNKIMSHSKFQNYWKNYTLSDMRPRVIKKGEMGLSKIIKKCISNSDEMSVLFNVHRFIKFLYSDVNLVKGANKYCRLSKNVGWESFHINQVHTLVSSYIKNTLHTMDSDNINLKNLDYDAANLNLKGVYDFESYQNFLQSNNIDFKEEFILSKMIATLSKTYVQGSQIHQNYGFNYLMGCGILKNDALYRGMLNYEDIVNMGEFLNQQDYEEYTAILTKTAFGSESHVGWKKVAFEHGYI